MSASAAVWPDPFGRLRITSPATPCHLSFLLPIADHRLNSLHLPSPAPPPFAPFTHSIPIGPHSGLLEHAVSAMLRSTLRPPRGLCRRSTADTALMCSRQLWVYTWATGQGATSQKRAPEPCRSHPRLPDLSGTGSKCGERARSSVNRTLIFRPIPQVPCRRETRVRPGAAGAFRARSTPCRLAGR